MTIFILFSVLTGMIAGYLLQGSAFIHLADSIVSLSLAALLFLIGVELGSKRTYLLEIKKWGWQLLFLPLLAGAGSILGGIIGAYFLNIRWFEGAAIGSGFGWYSLSGVLIADLYSIKLGAVGFLANVFRELLAFLLIPVILNRMGGGPAVALGGAASMDTLLPVIHKSSSGHYTLPAVATGIILSSLVPLLVPFFLSFAI